MPAKRLDRPSLKATLVGAALAPLVAAAACSLGLAAAGLRLEAGLGSAIAAGAASAAALSALVWYGLDRALVRPVAELTNEIAAVRVSGDLEQRIAASGADAFAPLVEEFNALLGANEQAFRAIAMALTDARVAAETANVSKSQFLANMSHEIRTPLNGVLAVVDALSRTPLKRGQSEMVELVRTSGQTLERILSDVLDLSRIESGNLQLEIRAFDLAETAEGIGSLMSLRAKEKDVDFLLELGIERPTWVAGDEVRIKQVLGNLLSNAVKFTERGQVRLSVRRQDDRFLFTVSDTGVGFDAAQKEAIFRRFQQADNSITRRYGGTGLGLAISTELASRMGGELDCFSIPGRGSRFWLTLPLEPAAAPDAPPALDPGALSAAQAGSPLRVLLADDHPVNRRVVELILQAADVDLVQVEDGQAAVESFAPGDFDLVLMDMQMPLMDGLAATRAIRLREQAAGAPPARLLMLTANAGAEHVRSGAMAGADGHLTKPITADALLRLVEDVRASRERAAG